jgi:hypothetical protein
MRRDDDPGYPWHVTFEHEPDCTMYALPTDMFRSFSTEAEATAAWNRRATLKSHGQAFDAAGVREACAKVIDAESKSCKEMEGMELAPESLQWARASEELAMAALKIRALPIPEVPARVEPVADDVRRLVIAAREAWEVMGDCSADASYSANLDKALEAFSSRVTYENEPGNGGGFDPVDRYPTHEEWDTAPPSPGFGGGDLREAVAPFLCEIDRLEKEYGFDRPMHQGQCLMLPLSALISLRAAALSHDQRGGPGE